MNLPRSGHAIEITFQAVVFHMEPMIFPSSLLGSGQNILGCMYMTDIQRKGSSYRGKQQGEAGGGYGLKR